MVEPSTEVKRVDEARAEQEKTVAPQEKKMSKPEDAMPVAPPRKSLRRKTAQKSDEKTSAAEENKPPSAAAILHPISHVQKPPPRKENQDQTVPEFLLAKEKILSGASPHASPRASPRVSPRGSPIPASRGGAAARDELPKPVPRARVGPRAPPPKKQEEEDAVKKELEAVRSRVRRKSPWRRKDEDRADSEEPKTDETGSEKEDPSKGENETSSHPTPSPRIKRSAPSSPSNQVAQPAESKPFDVKLKRVAPRPPTNDGGEKPSPPPVRPSRPPSPPRQDSREDLTKANKRPAPRPPQPRVVPKDVSSNETKRKAKRQAPPRPAGNPALISRMQLTDRGRAYSRRQVIERSQAAAGGTPPERPLPYTGGPAGKRPAPKPPPIERKEELDEKMTLIEARQELHQLRMGQKKLEERGPELEEQCRNMMDGKRESGRDVTSFVFS